MTKILKENKIKTLVVLSVIGVILTFVLYSCLYNKTAKKDLYKDLETIVYHSSENYKQAYLSDMTPIAKSIGYKDLVNDADTDGNPIVLNVEKNLFTFKKGLFAHANALLVYDLNEYSDYNYFTTFIGLNNTSSRGDGVTYRFYTSPDNVTWTEIGEGIKKLPKEEATFVTIPLNGAKYLKLEVDDNAGNGADHSVFADAKLVTEVNGNFVLDTAESYANEITTKYNNTTGFTEEIEMLVLKRELVKNVGQYTINSFYNESIDNKAVIDWLLGNKKALNYYILGGKPNGTYYNSLSELSILYRNYKEDFENTGVTENGTVLGDLYLRMATSLSLTHSGLVGLWMKATTPENKSDSVRRYAIMKYMHTNNLFTGVNGASFNSWFEDYTVEEMRYVMANNIDDESILWLNAYTQELVDKAGANGGSYLYPHKYIAYVWPNYANPVYYAEENVEYFNELFSVPDKNNEGQRIGLWDVTYTVPGGKDVPEYTLKVTRGTSTNPVYKVWMNMRNKFGTGAVCGGISKTGANIRGVHGLPAAVVGQPGHAAHLNYSRNANGDGFWSIDNDVSGWAYTGPGGRSLLGWGNASYASGYSGTYIPLAQDVMNNNDTYEQSQKYAYLAGSYDDLAKREEMYRKALEIQPLNLDAWYGLILTYNNSSVKTENQYYELAEEIAESLKYYPLPMYQMTNQIKPKLTSVTNSYKFALLQTRTLKEVKDTPNGSPYVLQPGITRLMANFLLGSIDNSIASFSFDGFDAGKIVLSSRFDNAGVRWDYSLDGKKTWNEVSFTGDEEHKLQLTSEQIRSITSENDIYVHIVGVDYEEKNLFKIDITDGTLLSSIYANDLENRVIGVNLNTEWRYRTSDSWTSYSVSSPDLTGNKTIQVRQAATGTALASNVSEMFVFTEDNQSNTRRYIPVSHLSIHDVSTEAVNNAGSATFAIDGNYNTRWHSAWNGTDTERFITIKLDKPRYVSAVEYVPAGGGNGKILDGTIYGSVDGENWVELSKLNNIRYTNQTNSVADAIANTKVFEIDDPQEVQYIKIVADNATQGHYMAGNGNWFTARAFNLYQDLSRDDRPTAGIAYSTTESTRERVVARLINPSSEITITNNNGSDTYIFNENGEFTFEFVDKKGKAGSATAKVDWIDKDIPTADVKYELDTNHKIIISLDSISEAVYLLDKNDKPINYVNVKNGKVTSLDYLDSKGNIYKTVEVDENGCITRIIYENTSNQVTVVGTYVTVVNGGVVTSEEYYDKEGNSIVVSDIERELLKSLQQSIANPLEYTFEQSGDYEFKMLDKANNIAYKSIKVEYNNDNTIVSSDITYDITYLTNKNVVATINANVIDQNGQKKSAQIIGGSSTHVFDKNGSFTFKYINTADPEDVKEHTAKVNWIDKKAPTAQIKYTKQANGQVVATLYNESEQINLINNNLSREYVFNKNGEFTFEFEDIAGNVGRATAKVDWIKEEVIENNKPGNNNQTKPNQPSDSDNSEEDNKPGNEEDNNNKPSTNPSKPNDKDQSDKNDTTNQKEGKVDVKLIIVIALIFICVIGILIIKLKKESKQTW